MFGQNMHTMLLSSVYGTKMPNNEDKLIIGKVQYIINFVLAHGILKTENIFSAVFCWSK